MTPVWWRSLNSLLWEHARGGLPDTKLYLAEARLSTLAARLGLPGITELVAACTDPAVADQVVSAILVHETTFRRDDRVFTALERQVLPELAARDAGALRVWSAACSTGQEPLSLVMSGRSLGIEVSVCATDADPLVVDRARAGRYTQLEVNRGLPHSWLVSHFSRAGIDWQIHDDVLSRVTHRTLVLGRDRAPGSFPLVVARNVLMYLEGPVRDAAEATLAGAVRPGGYLLLGTAESLRTRHGLQPCQVGEAWLWRRSTDPGDPLNTPARPGTVPSPDQIRTSA